MPTTRPNRDCQGPIPIDEALPIAKQIAGGTGSRARTGHHSSRPEAANIKLRPDGTVKVLDFGLAKAPGAGNGAISTRA